jgi:uncharacterized membrane protein
VQHTAIDKRRRLEAIDFARGSALLAMAIYHFAWDLEFFGYVEPGMTADGGWRLFARSIASSFLFLVGVSLFLAHAESIRWRPFLKRLAMVAGAAAAISLVTFLAMPGAFIFFGILHQIALASLLGLAFLRLPPLVTMAIAAAVIVAPNYLRAPFFDHPALWWIGLAPVNPHSNDYVPVFPWFGAVLLGIAAAKTARAAGVFERMRGWRLGGWSRPVQFAGRHSLAVYLIHQPVLIASLWLFSQVVPPAEPSRELRFMRACEGQCEASESSVFCPVYCGCVLDRLLAEGRFDEVYDGAPSAETSQRLQALVAECTLAAQEFDNGEDSQ